MLESEQHRNSSVPRPEYPRPILRRERWFNLNGLWGFAADPDAVGLVENWQTKTQWPSNIMVPFAPCSDASKCFLNAQVCNVWYHRVFQRPDWQEAVFLNIGACDYATKVFINGQLVGTHIGGYSPIKLEITRALTEGDNHIVIAAKDSGSWQQPRGKQAGDTRWPIDYSPVIGIWQTVWLEPANPIYIEHLSYAYKLDSKELFVTVNLSDYFDGAVQIRAKLGGLAREQTTSPAPTEYQNDQASKVYSLTQQCDLRCEIKTSLIILDAQLWSPESPQLYDITVVLVDAQGQEIDKVFSYSGLREISVVGKELMLNDKSLYLRGVLDQGYFPEGWYTALDDGAIVKDIELTKRLGFNLVRKHQKAEDPRYLYWADKLGLMVWSEMPSGRIFSNELVAAVTREWADLVRRDQAHPCIICWVPFNESWGAWHQSSRPQQRAFVDGIYHLTKALDQSRPVVANDGWEFSSGDLWTLHLYESSADDLGDRLNKLQVDPYGTVSDADGSRVATLPGADPAGLPILLTECGGVGFTQMDQDEAHFSYGEWPSNEDELLARISDLGLGLQSLGDLRGFVWTQLTDVEQEINGLLYFNRVPKLPIEKLNKVFSSIGSS